MHCSPFLPRSAFDCSHTLSYHRKACALERMQGFESCQSRLIILTVSIAKSQKGIWRGDDQAYNSKGLIDGSQTAPEKSQFCKTHDTKKSFSTHDAAQILLNIES